MSENPRFSDAALALAPGARNRVVVERLFWENAGGRANVGATGIARQDQRSVAPWHERGALSSTRFPAEVGKDFVRGTTRFWKGQQAHHIVPSTHRRAEEAQNLLERFDIDINSAANGVNLKHSLHHGKGFHSHRGIEKVTNLLKEAAQNGSSYRESKQNVLDALKAIAEQMKSGTFAI